MMPRNRAPQARTFVLIKERRRDDCTARASPPPARPRLVENADSTVVGGAATSAFRWCWRGRSRPGVNVNDLNEDDIVCAVLDERHAARVERRLARYGVQSESDDNLNPLQAQEALERADACGLDDRPLRDKRTWSFERSTK